MKSIDDKIPEITNVANKTALNAKINEVKGEISSINKEATKVSLTVVENKVISVSNLAKKLTSTQNWWIFSRTKTFRSKCKSWITFV